MKKHFTKYLIEDLGFKAFRNKKDGLTPDDMADFSTMVYGGTQRVYIKDDISIIWGLSEMGKPPTLIYPRPNIKGGNASNLSKEDIDKNFLIGGIFFNTDDDINRILRTHSNEEIYEAMFDKSIILEFK